MSDKNRATYHGGDEYQGREEQWIEDPTYHEDDFDVTPTGDSGPFTQAIRSVRPRHQSKHAAPLPEPVPAEGHITVTPTRRRKATGGHYRPRPKPPRFDFVLGVGLALTILGAMLFPRADGTLQLSIVGLCIGAGSVLMSQAIYTIVSYLKNDE